MCVCVSVSLSRGACACFFVFLCPVSFLSAPFPFGVPPFPPESRPACGYPNGLRRPPFHIGLGQAKRDFG